MAAAIDEKVLDEKLAGLEKARAWSPRVISKLEALLRHEDDFALYNINPLKFAADKGISESEAIDLFLHATKAGLFTMSWHLLCPSCGDAVKSFATLGGVRTQLHCSLCHVDTLAQLDDYIEVSFVVSGQVRAIAPHHPESLSAADYHMRYRFSQNARYPNGSKFVEVWGQHVKHLSYLEPGETRRLDFDVAPGYFVAHDLMRETGSLFTVSGHAHSGRKELVITAADAFSPLEAELTPGAYSVEVRSTTSQRGSLLIGNFPFDVDHEEIALVFDPFLSGKRLLTTQTFRDLFRSETLVGNEGLGVKDLTLLFTDLKGSTALYDRIGDLKAFSLVQQHFDHLTRAVSAHCGAVVKTIGDAVMASFLNPVDAVKAALVMLQEIEKFNAEQGARDIILKIGVHKGPLIAVNLNDRLDYFGQTVNIAARVQGLAEADEICVTDDVYAYPGVAQLLGETVAVPEGNRLKGVAREMRVRRMQFKLSASSA
jgi:class 3 adenylate cyclase